jgi:hypothetical protein
MTLRYERRSSTQMPWGRAFGFQRTICPLRWNTPLPPRVGPTLLTEPQDDKTPLTTDNVVGPLRGLYWILREIV